MNTDPDHLISKERIKKIYKFMDEIGINKSQLELIKKNEFAYLNILNEALTHTSANACNNHERLEFLGDAVLRLVASEYIQNHFPSLKVGDRSALRAQLVSDEWLSKVGEKLNIKEIMVTGITASKDSAASATLQAEATEALIGALYECLNNFEVISDWLSPYWDETSEFVLADPHRLNSKSALQEWSQGKGIERPRYKTEELSKQHGDLKRFFSKVFIQEKFFGEGWGSSRKQAEKEAARIALENIEKFK